MNLRLTASCRYGLLRLGSVPGLRPFSIKAKNHPSDAASESLSKHFTARKRNLLMNYINLLYKGQDKRLKSFHSTMDKVHKFRCESGPLKSLDDLTRMVGLSLKEAKDLCEEICQSTVKKRNPMQYSYPVFTAQSVENVLAIHTSLYCVTWAHLEKSGLVRSWHKEVLPLGEKQKHTIDCIQAVVSFQDKIPRADAYILETPDIRRSKDLSGAADGFMLSNINCSILSILACLHAKNRMNPRIYYMNRNLVPLLFDLSVGGEVVSRFKVVEEIINKPDPDRKEFRDIVLDDWLRDFFKEGNDIVKEELSIPLLAAIAAMEILVRQNPAAIDKVIAS